MRMSQTGVDMLKKFEGFVGHAYKALETEEHFTIGYGHYGSDVDRNDTITQTQAEILLKRDVSSFEDGVSRLIRVPVNQNQFDALVSLAYNIGLRAFGSSTLLKRLNAKDYRTASAQFLVWNKSGGRVISGLVNRRKQERALFDKPVPKPTPKTKPYTVKKNDNLTTIAKKYKTTVGRLVDLNKAIKDPDKVYEGQVIRVPNN